MTYNLREGKKLNTMFIQLQNKIIS